MFPALPCEWYCISIHPPPQTFVLSSQRIHMLCAVSVPRGRLSLGNFIHIVVAKLPAPSYPVCWLHVRLVKLWSQILLPNFQYPTPFPPQRSKAFGIAKAWFIFLPLCYHFCCHGGNFKLRPMLINVPHNGRYQVSYPYKRNQNLRQTIIFIKNSRFFLKGMPSATSVVPSAQYSKLSHVHISDFDHWNSFFQLREDVSYAIDIHFYIAAAKCIGSVALELFCILSLFLPVVLGN